MRLQFCVVCLFLPTASAVATKYKAHDAQGKNESYTDKMYAVSTPMLHAVGDDRSVGSAQYETDSRSLAGQLLQINRYQSRLGQFQLQLQTVTQKYMEHAADQLSGVTLRATPAEKPALQQIAQQMALPVVGIIGGGLLMCLDVKVVGLTIMFFGSQIGLNIYMKLVLSEAEISEELHMRGVPAAFLVTAIQQLISFILFALFLGATYFTPFRYTPKRLTRWSDVAKVFLLGAAFAANIGLNNFSLSYLPISTNVTIRSCVPLATYVLNKLIRSITKSDAVADDRELLLLTIGVLGAGLVTVAQAGGRVPQPGADSEHFMLGVIISVVSVLACGLNLVLAGLLGSEVKLNPLDTLWYMSIPVAAMLVPLASIAHPCSWPGLNPATDWQVMMKVLQLSPNVVLLMLFSGVLATGYNFLMYVLVQTVSASYTALAGNFNKVPTIMLSLLLGMEQLPQGNLKFLMLIGVLANIVSFAMFNTMRSPEKKDQANLEKKDQANLKQQEHNFEVNPDKPDV